MKSKKDSCGFPSWVGHYPFAPKEKQACLLKESIKRVYGRDPHRIPTQLHASTDLLTVTSFRIPPGGYIVPPDIHTGDELYWVLKGRVTVSNPETGQTEIIGVGEALWIPEGTWHQTFNMGNETLEVLCFFSPTIWSESSRGTNIYYDKGFAYFSTSSSEAIAEVKHQNLSGQRGHFPGGWPSEWHISREKKGLLKIGRDNVFNLIWGKKSFCQASIYLSCERQHIVFLSIPAGGHSDLEIHMGDEVIYCLSGEISVLTGKEATEEKSVSIKRLLAQAGELLLIPSGIEHCYYNLGDKPANCLLGIAPDLRSKKMKR